MANKTINYIIYTLLAISLCVNIYFTYNNVIDKIVTRVDGKTILTENELISYYSDNYKVTVVNQKVNDYLLMLEAKNRGITEPTDEELQYITKTFPSFVGYNSDIDKQRAALTEAHYVYKIFQQDGIDISSIYDFLEDRYGNRDTNIYEVYLYDTHNHTHAVEVENMLKAGNSINDVEEHLNIKFFTSYVLSMDNLLSGGEDVTGASMLMSHDMSRMNDITTNTEDNVALYAIGDVFHVMDGVGMQIILINNILSVDTDIEHFESLYFAQRYTSIKNNIINDLKGKYVVSYY